MTVYLYRHTVIIRGCLLLLVAIFSGCSFLSPGPESAREAYWESLEEAGLAKTQLGLDWQEAGHEALASAVNTLPPVHERLWIEAGEIRAVAYQFQLQAGESVIAEVQSKDWKLAYLSQSSDGQPKAKARQTSGRLFLDIYRNDRGQWIPAGSFPKSSPWQADHAGSYLFLLQPELSRQGRFDIRIEVLPALKFPVSGKGPAAIQSFFGAPRDGGRRVHHGVDIFAQRGTPVLAAVSGPVTRTGDTPRGGLHVWQRGDHGRRLYYAHLDDILVTSGDFVKAGQIIGTVGNTGNARWTPPHLHFGVYQRFSGPTDPLPLLSGNTLRSPGAMPDELTSSRWQVNASKLYLRQGPSTRDRILLPLSRGQVLVSQAAAGSWIRVNTQAGDSGYVHGDYLSPLSVANPLL